MTSESKLSSIRQTFGDEVCRLASAQPDIWVVSVGLTPSLCLDKFAKKFRTRFIEVGVSENNAAGVAAGLAKGGKTVILATYACFSPGLNWAVIRQSICENNLAVIIVGSHAGLATGDLGESHQMLEDVALMRALPGLEVFAPLDSQELKRILPVLIRSRHPSYLRLYRPSSVSVYPATRPFTIGKSVKLSSGSDATVIGYGLVLFEALKIKDWRLDIINCSSLKPLDTTTIIDSVRKTGKCLVIEDHQKNGGLGEAVAKLLLENGLHPRFAHLAVDDQFGQSARDWQDLYRHYGLNSATIISTLKNL